MTRFEPKLGLKMLKIGIAVLLPACLLTGRRDDAVSLLHAGWQRARSESKNKAASVQLTIT
jgi:hypothetical protein